MMPKFFVIILVIGAASAATFIGKPPVKPKEFADQVGCYVKEIKAVVPYGAVLTPVGVCYRITCGSEWMDYASCGTVSTSDPEHCHVTEMDLSKPYPHCCPDVKCDVDNNVL